MAEGGLCFFTFCLARGRWLPCRTLSLHLGNLRRIRAENTHSYDKIRASQELQKKTDLIAFKGASLLTVVHKSRNQSEITADLQYVRRGARRFGALEAAST